MRTGHRSTLHRRAQPQRPPHPPFEMPGGHPLGLHQYLAGERMESPETSQQRSGDPAWAGTVTWSRGQSPGAGAAASLSAPQPATCGHRVPGCLAQGCLSTGCEEPNEGGRQGPGTQSPRAAYGPLSSTLPSHPALPTLIRNCLLALWPQKRDDYIPPHLPGPAGCGMRGGPSAQAKARRTQTDRRTLSDPEAA